MIFPVPSCEATQVIHVKCCCYIIYQNMYMSYIDVVLYISNNTSYINASILYSLRFKLLAASASFLPSPLGGEAAEPPWGRGRWTCLKKLLTASFDYQCML